LTRDRTRVQVRRAALASAIGTDNRVVRLFLYNTGRGASLSASVLPRRPARTQARCSRCDLFRGLRRTADRGGHLRALGRPDRPKTTLIITLLVMGIASAVIVILPGTATIGVAAPLLLVTLRVLAGHAVGGEWSGSVLLTMEWGDQNRPVCSKFRQIGGPGRAGAGTGGMTLLSATMVDDAFNSWGWRLPSWPPVQVAVGLVIRLRSSETPMFTKVLTKQDREHPVAEVVRRHWREILLSAGLRSPSRCRSTCSHVRLDLRRAAPPLQQEFELTAVLVGAAVELATIPYFSHLSDRWAENGVSPGRRGHPPGCLRSRTSRADLRRPVLIFTRSCCPWVVHSMMYGTAGRADRRELPKRICVTGAPGLGYNWHRCSRGGPAPLVADVAASRDRGRRTRISYIRRGRGHHGVCCVALPAVRVSHRRRSGSTVVLE